jgi:hypothetical protein
VLAELEMKIMEEKSPSISRSFGRGEDTVDKLSPKSLAIVGAVTLETPPEATNYF